MNHSKKIQKKHCPFKILFCIITIAFSTISIAADRADKLSDNILKDLKLIDIHGNNIQADKFKNKALLIVNTASHCGYTYQYEDLQKLQKLFNGKPFEIIAVPTGDYGSQEFDSNVKIEKFLYPKNLNFTVLQKHTLKGDKKCTLYEKIDKKEKSKNISKKISWNFEKILLDKQHNIVKKFSSSINPMDKKLIQTIKQTLGKK